MRITSEDTTNEGIAESNQSRGGETAALPNALAARYIVRPAVSLKSLPKSQEMLVQNEEELCLLINPSPWELRGQSPSVS